MPSEPERFDAVVVGAGAGGLTVAVGLAGLGRRVALVEAGRVGGDCTNVGCIPSKRLLHLARTGRREGPAALADVRATRDGLARREREEMDTAENVTLVEGRARLEDARTVVVDGDGGTRRLRGRDVVLATGSRPRGAPVPGLDALALDNESVFELEAPPRHLAILGAGAVGLELADAFHRLGSRVTLIEAAPRVLAAAGAEASDALAAALAERGVDVRVATRATRYEPEGAVLAVRGTSGDERLEGVDRVLVAVGRSPAVTGLGLDRAGLAESPDGIAVDGWGRTRAPGLWAVGDATPGSHQTHAANAAGRRAVQRIALPWLPPVGGRPLVPSAVFTDPEVAWVGPRAGELARRLRPEALTTIRVELAETDRGLTDGVQNGFVSVTAIRLTGRIVAATVVGPAASELITTLTLAMRRRVSLLSLQRQVYPYPTYSGAIGAVADEFARRTLPSLPRELAGYLRHRWARPARGRSGQDTE